MNPNSPNNTNSVGAVRLTNAAGGFTSGTKADDKKIVPSNPFVKFGYVLLFITALTSIAVFLYDRYLNTISNKTLEEALSYRNQVSALPLLEMHDLLNKLNVFNDIASKHTRVTTVFRFIETITNKNVYWKSMSARFNEKGSMEISLSGSALNYVSVIQQMDELKESKYREFMSVPVLTGNVSKTDDKVNGKSEVSFGIKFNFLIPYEDSKAGTIFDKLLYGNKSNISNSKLNASSTPSPISIILSSDTPTTTKSLGAGIKSVYGTNTEIIKNTQKNINNLIKNSP